MISRVRGKARAGFAGASAKPVWTVGLRLGPDREEPSSRVRQPEPVVLGKASHLSEVSFLTRMPTLQDTQPSCPLSLEASPCGLRPDLYFQVGLACGTSHDREREEWKVGAPSSLHGRRALSLTEGHIAPQRQCPLHSFCLLSSGNHGNRSLPLSDPFLQSPNTVHEGTDLRYFRLCEPHAYAPIFFFFLLSTTLDM